MLHVKVSIIFAIVTTCNLQASHNNAPNSYAKNQTEHSEQEITISPLNIVTPVNHLQKIIIEYMGHSWLLKKITAYSLHIDSLNFMSATQLIIKHEQAAQLEIVANADAHRETAALCPNGECLAYYHGDLITLVCLKNKNSLKIFSCPGPDHITALAWLTNSKLIIGRPAEIALWDIGGAHAVLIKSYKSKWVSNIWPLYKSEQNTGCIALMGHYWHAPDRAHISYMQIWEDFAQDKKYNQIELDIPVHLVHHALSPNGECMAIATGKQLRVYENPAAILLSRISVKEITRAKQEKQN